MDILCNKRIFRVTSYETDCVERRIYAKSICGIKRKMNFFELHQIFWGEQYVCTVHRLLKFSSVKRVAQFKISAPELQS